MKTKLPALAAVLLLVIASCKKDKETPAPAGNNGGVVQGSNAPTDFSNCYGEVMFIKDSSLNLGSAVVGSNIVEAVFYSAPLTSANNSMIDVGVFDINGTVFKKYPGYGYNDSTHKLQPLGVFTVSASGNSTVQPITFRYSDGQPVFTDTSAIPSAISRAQGLSMALSRFANADSLVVTLSANGQLSVTKRFSGTAPKPVNVSISPAEIASLNTSQSVVYVRVKALKKRLLTVNSRDYLVSFSKGYTKYNIRLNP